MSEQLTSSEMVLLVRSVRFAASTLESYCRNFPFAEAQDNAFALRELEEKLVRMRDHGISCSCGDAKEPAVGAACPIPSAVAPTSMIEMPECDH